MPDGAAMRPLVTRHVTRFLVTTRICLQAFRESSPGTCSHSRSLASIRGQHIERAARARKTIEDRGAAKWSRVSAHFHAASNSVILCVLCASVLKEEL